MERGKLTLHVAQSNIVAFISRLCDDFQQQAQLQHIHLDFHSETDTVMGWFDSRQLRKVFSN